MQPIYGTLEISKMLQYIISSIESASSFFFYLYHYETVI